MTTEITEPTTQVSGSDTAPTIGGQAAVAEALVALIEMFGDLPAPYITIHAPRWEPAVLGLQLDNPEAFELWRTALGIAPSGVELHANASQGWLQAEGVFHGVGINLTGHGVTLPTEQDEPQAVDETSSAVSA